MAVIWLFERMPTDIFTLVSVVVAGRVVQVNVGTALTVTTGAGLGWGCGLGAGWGAGCGAGVRSS